jgi:CheY-like chemotaxis protein
VQTIKDSGDAMLALLNDILDFSKIESGGMQLEIVDFDLQRLLDGVVRLMSGHASQKDIFIKAEVAHDVPRYLKGDPTRLRQVLLNFVGNAIKFTSEGGVTIHVYIDPDFPALYERPNETPIKFVIEDTGIGISEDGQKKLFTPFAQADSSISRKFGGTGLGLAICKRLIEAMGSKIELKSVEGQGSKFFFTLAMDKGESDAIVDEMATAQANQQKAAGVRLTILVVDDNEINRKVVQGILTKYGHKSVVAENGGDAVAMAEYNPFDLILMDIELPDMNGVEATKLIRHNPKIPKQPHIAALTGNVQQEAIDYYIESGMDSHLAKPIEPQKIEQLLNFLAAQKTGGQPLAQTEAGAEVPPSMPQQAQEQTPPQGSVFEDAQDFNMGQAPQQPSQPAAQEHAPSSPNPEQQPHPQPEMPSQQNEVSAQQNPQELETNEAALQGDVPEQIQQSSAVEQAMQGEYIAEDKPADEVQGDIATDAKIAELFDEPMLAGLKDAMGFDQLNELMQPLFEKNDELVADLQKALEDENWLVVKERGHEMKGMNGNFGLIKLQDLGGKLEAMAREDVTDKGAYAVVINQLPKYKDESREVLESWMRK